MCVCVWGEGERWLWNVRILGIISGRLRLGGLGDFESKGGGLFLLVAPKFRAMLLFLIL